MKDRAREGSNAVILIQRAVDNPAASHLHSSIRLRVDRKVPGPLLLQKILRREWDKQSVGLRIHIM